jgi:hypothetical protein
MPPDPCQYARWAEVSEIASENAATPLTAPATPASSERLAKYSSIRASNGRVGAGVKFLVGESAFDFDPSICHGRNLPIILLIALVARAGRAGRFVFLEIMTLPSVSLRRQPAFAGRARSLSPTALDGRCKDYRSKRAKLIRMTNLITRVFHRARKRLALRGASPTGSFPQALLDPTP